MTKSYLLFPSALQCCPFPWCTDHHINIGACPEKGWTKRWLVTSLSLDLTLLQLAKGRELYKGNFWISNSNMI